MRVSTALRSVWHTITVEVSVGLICVYFFTAAAQSFPDAAMSIFLYNDLGLIHSPDRVTRYYAALFFPTFAKAGYGLLTDLLPFRRGFIVAAANAVASILTAVIAFYVNSYNTLFSVGVCSAIMQALSEAIADTILVDKVKRIQEKEGSLSPNEDSGGDVAARLQATALGARTVASLIGSLVATPLLKVFSVKRIILISAGLYALAVLAALFMVFTRADERVDTRHASPMRQLERLWTAVLNECRRYLNEKKRPSRIVAVVLFLFLLNAMPNVLDVYASWTYSQSLSNWQFSFVGNMSMVGALTAVLLYAGMSERLSRHLRITFVVTVLLSSGAGMTRIAALHWPYDVFPFLVVDNFITTMASRLALLSTVTIATVWAPSGFEGLGFNAIASATDAGQEVSAQIGASLVKRLRLGEPPGRSWKNLKRYIILTSFLKVVILPLIFIIPKKTQASEESSDNQRTNETSIPLLEDCEEYKERLDEDAEWK